MNMLRHIGEHMKLFNHLVVGDDDSGESHNKFYDENLSVGQQNFISKRLIWFSNNML